MNKVTSLKFAIVEPTLEHFTITHLSDKYPIISKAIELNV